MQSRVGVGAGVGASVLLSAEQFAVLHACSSSNSGQLAPELDEGEVIVRQRFSNPPPQVTEHRPHVPHADTPQSTGHTTCALHVSFADTVGHCKPPCCEATNTLRLCVCMPPMHALLHVLQLPQLDTSQSIGHACVLHDTLSCSEPHSVPPQCDGAVTARLRIDWPALHTLEHTP